MDIQGGQFLEMTLLDPSETEAERNTRTLSIPMLPHEETLMEATRMRNTAFKRGLNTTPPGSAVKVEGPSGTQPPLDDIKRMAAYVAGGIGLTPFRSIAFRAAKEKLPHRI
jgi:NAD(P)H-flavin reductase